MKCSKQCFHGLCSLLLFVVIINVYWIFLAPPESPTCTKPQFKAIIIEEDNYKGLLNMMGMTGFEQTSKFEDAQLIWTTEESQTKLEPLYQMLSAGQKINQIPGFNALIVKENLAMSNLTGVPPGFKIPKDAEKLREFAQKNPKAMFVKKHFRHSGVMFLTVDKLGQVEDESFVQQFIDNQFLIDGYGFDIGVYIAVTSVDPLRVYIYEEDIRIKFCTEPFHPFDPTNKAKYVVDDFFLRNHSSLFEKVRRRGYSSQESFNFYMRSVGKEPHDIWKQMENVTVSALTHVEHSIASKLKVYSQKRSFFELFRADFLIDADCRVHLLEFERQPLLRAGYQHNQFQKMLHDTLSLVMPGTFMGGLWCHSQEADETEVQTPEHSLWVFSDECSLRCNSSDTCLVLKCSLCKSCINEADLASLRESHWERKSNVAFRRLFPPPLTREEALMNSKKLKWLNVEPGVSWSNKKMKHWFLGKCLMNDQWCH